MATTVDTGIDALEVVFVHTNVPPPMEFAFNVSGDFAIGSNPNGVWSYGVKESLVGELELLSHSQERVGPNEVVYEAWEYTQGQWPAVYHNSSTNVLISDGGAGMFPPGAVWYGAGEAGTDRNYGAIRFTVPSGGSGVYRILASVETALKGEISGDADFHVVANESQLFEEFLEPNSATTFSNEVGLVEGDVVDFLVGRGADGELYASQLLFNALEVTRVHTNLPPEVPRLEILMVGEHIVVHWHGEGWQLEEGVKFDGDATLWTPVETFSNFYVTHPDGTAKYYRLRKD